MKDRIKDSIVWILFLVIGLIIIYLDKPPQCEPTSQEMACADAIITCDRMVEIFSNNK